MGIICVVHEKAFVDLKTITKYACKVAVGNRLTIKID